MKPQMLNIEQRGQWNRDGYLVLKNVLSPDEITRFKTALERLYDAKRSFIESKPFSLGLDWKFVVNEDEVFIGLMDHPATFGIILDVLGPCIQLCMSHALTRPAEKEEFKGFIHTDGGEGMQSVHVTDFSRPLQIKIQYFLTDLKDKDSGNFSLVPGSHHRPFPTENIDRDAIYSQTKQVIVEAGDAAIFVNSLWHGVGINTSAFERKSLIYGYNQLFLRPYDYSSAPKDLLEKCTPRQRRLLGDMGTDKPQAYYYAPQDQVVIMEKMDVDSLRAYEKLI